MKFRGLQPNPNMPAADFLFFAKKLERDSMDGELDPYMYKYAVQPPKR